MNWFLLALRKYAVFSGRSQRSEYWYFVLFYMLTCLATSILDWMLGTYSSRAEVGLLSGLSQGGRAGGSSSSSSRCWA